MSDVFDETLVTYTLNCRGKLYVIEHVPARVSRVSGEQFFAPETVEKIHRLVRDGKQPTRLIQTPVYEYA